MDRIIVNQATLQDITIIQQIGRETFFEAFAGDNSEEDMTSYLEAHFSEEKVGLELSDPGSAFFLARENGTVIGYMKLNTGRAQTELQDEAALEIERIYVRAAYYGKRVGQLLYEKALEIATRDKRPYIWLGVWEQNARAINFYKKQGFFAFGKHLFRLGNDEQVDVMMKKIIE